MGGTGSGKHSGAIVKIDGKMFWKSKGKLYDVPKGNRKK